MIYLTHNSQFTDLPIVSERLADRDRDKDHTYNLAGIVTELVTLVPDILAELGIEEKHQERAPDHAHSEGSNKLWFESDDIGRVEVASKKNVIGDSDQVEGTEHKALSRPDDMHGFVGWPGWGSIFLKEVIDTYDEEDRDAGDNDGTFHPRVGGEDVEEAKGDIGLEELHKGCTDPHGYTRTDPTPDGSLSDRDVDRSKRNRP